MFQIISGKFFDSDDCFHNDCKIVLYSNAHFTGNHRIGHATIESTELDDDISTYVISYDNKLQKQHSAFQVIKVGDEEIAYQIANLLAISLNCIWGEDRDRVKKLCSNKIGNACGICTLSTFIPMTVDLKRNISDDELIQADLFIQRVVGLSRTDYTNIMQCIIAYNESIQHLPTDVSLAYSVLVYALESLAQKYDQYVATWEDYYQEAKAKLDLVFQELDAPISSNIKEILISEKNFKLSQRFRDFVLSNVSESFFEKSNGRYSICKDDFTVALNNAYKARSQYVHTLAPVMKLLTDTSFTKNHDSIEVQHNVFFTYSGLLRLVREVIDTFVSSLPQVESENTDWYHQLPNCITAEVAPYFWIWKDSDTSGIYAKERFEGFIECLLFYKDHIPNMETVLLQYMTHIDEMKADRKYAAFALCWLYYSTEKITNKENKVKLEQSIEYSKELFSNCNIYSLTAIELTFRTPIDINWETQTVEKVVEEYRKKKYGTKGIKLPPLVELLLYYRLAQLFQEDADNEEQNKWLQIAYDASNNTPQIRQETKELLADNSVTIKLDSLLALIYSKDADIE